MSANSATFAHRPKSWHRRNLIDNKCPNMLPFNGVRCCSGVGLTLGEALEGLPLMRPAPSERIAPSCQSSCAQHVGLAKKLRLRRVKTSCRFQPQREKASNPGNPTLMPFRPEAYAWKVGKLPARAAYSWLKQAPSMGPAVAAGEPRPLAHQSAGARRREMVQARTLQ